MRIRRPSRPEAPFKRKREAPPQATKLLRYSLLAGIVFIILLAIVFVPQMLIQQDKVATPVAMKLFTTTRLNATTFQIQLNVTSVGALVPLSKMKAMLLLNNTIAATIGPPLSGGPRNFAFTDANGDGLLGPGDYFTMLVGPFGCHRVDVLQIEPSSTFLVGFERWGGCPVT